MIYEMIKAFTATFMLAVIFNVNRRELIFCGFAGFVASGVYLTLMYFYSEVSLSTLVASATVTVMARILANVRKSPVTVYLVPGIITLVPGAKMYNMVFDMIASNYTEALKTGIDALKIASAIAVGIVLIFALPNRLFLKRGK